MSYYDGIRVEVVPDNDADAHPGIPLDVLTALTGDCVLMRREMMYVRASLWERIKDHFPLRDADHAN